MLIKRERLPNPSTLHDDERNAVGKRITLVTIAFEVRPTRVEQDLINLNKLAFKRLQLLANPHGPRVVPA
jgi:hypothetical protein